MIKKGINDFSIVDETFSKSRQEKYRKQREERGFDDTELWNLNTTIARFMLPRFIEFRKQTQGYPPTLTEAEWDVVLQNIINSLKNYIEEKENDCSTAMTLISKYFNNLWW